MADLSVMDRDGGGTAVIVPVASEGTGHISEPRAADQQDSDYSNINRSEGGGGGWGCGGDPGPDGTLN